MARNMLLLKRGWLLALAMLILLAAHLSDIGAHAAVVGPRAASSNSGGKGLEGKKCTDKLPHCARCSPGFKSCDFCEEFYIKQDGRCVCTMPGCDGGGIPPVLPPVTADPSALPETPPSPDPVPM